MAGHADPATGDAKYELATIDVDFLAPHFYSYKNKALNPTGPKQEGDFEEGTNKRRKLGPVIERLT